jgi:hypothetical protein
VASGNTNGIALREAAAAGAVEAAPLVNVDGTCVAVKFELFADPPSMSMGATAASLLSPSGNAASALTDDPAAAATVGSDVFMDALEEVSSRMADKQRARFVGSAVAAAEAAAGVGMGNGRSAFGDTPLRSCLAATAAGDGLSVRGVVDGEEEAAAVDATAGTRTFVWIISLRPEP